MADPGGRVTLEDLEHNERRALVALVHHTIRVDGMLSDEEIDSMSAVAAELGQEAWRAAFRTVLGSHHDEAQVLDLAAGVSRADARSLIREVLTRIAASDVLHASEEAFLARLDELWA